MKLFVNAIQMDGLRGTIDEESIRIRNDLNEIARFRQRLIVFSRESKKARKKHGQNESLLFIVGWREQYRGKIYISYLRLKFNVAATAAIIIQHFFRTENNTQQFASDLMWVAVWCGQSGSRPSLGWSIKEAILFVVIVGFERPVRCAIACFIFRDELIDDSISATLTASIRFVSHFLPSSNPFLSAKQTRKRCQTLDSIALIASRKKLSPQNVSHYSVKFSVVAVCLRNGSTQTVHSFQWIFRVDFDEHASFIGAIVRAR